MSGRRCWDGGPRQCLLSPPPRSNTAQPSQPGQAELRMNECWAGLAQPHCSTQHTRATDYRLQSYRATEYSYHTLIELSSRVALIEAPLQLYTRQSKYLQCLQQEASPVPSVL